MNWFFNRSAPLQSGFATVLWWELRRYPYNFIVAIFGIACLSVYGLAMTYVLEPDPPDLVEPLALIAAPLLINLAYTLGWIVELLLRRLGRPNRGPLLMKLGIATTLFVIALPAASWGLAAIVVATYRSLQA